MKQLFLSLSIILAISVGTVVAQTWDKTDFTNDFYDNAQQFDLKGAQSINVMGEISNPFILKLGDFPTHSIMVKETDFNDDEISFHGSYTYEGVSLYDLLNEMHLAKKNEKEFLPIIDLYIEVSNNKGDKASISWGEVYYPVNRHQIMIATKVSRIVPSKTNELWALPANVKLIVGTDLVTCRNIENPTKIEIKSLNCDYVVNREIKMWSKKINILDGDKVVQTLSELPKDLPAEHFFQVFYGRGRGIHGITDFRGAHLKDLLQPHFKPSYENYQNGMFVIAAVDGYRTAYTYSEIMNRNDNSEVMILDNLDYENRGKFTVIPAADFFSDRAVMAITEIKLLK